MNVASSALPTAAPDHITVCPPILYFGTPVVLLSTENQDATFNLAPMSSAWALGQVVVLGLGADGQTARNLAVRSELVVNLPAPSQWRHVERLAALTGRADVPRHKQGSLRYEPAKFEAAGVTPLSSELVRPPRVAEFPVHLEARAARIQPDASAEFVIVEAQVLRVHVRRDLVVPGTHHIDPARWSPLIYNFRHYFGLGDELGHSFRSSTPRTPAPTAREPADPPGQSHP
jgi:flavin reductase (DIM6/NTAB) family NADH-FMN oxidoreductase RutF